MVTESSTTTAVDALRARKACAMTSFSRRASMELWAIRIRAAGAAHRWNAYSSLLKGAKVAVLGFVGVCLPSLRPTVRCVTPASRSLRWRESGRWVVRAAVAGPLAASVTCSATVSAAGADVPAVFTSQLIPLPPLPPTPADARVQSLDLAMCPSIGDCVAVGTAQLLGDTDQPIVLEESDGMWTTTVPQWPPDGNPAIKLTGLSSLSCSTPGNCAVVATLVESTSTGEEAEVGMLLESEGSWSNIVLPGQFSGSISSLGCPIIGTCFFTSNGQAGPFEVAVGVGGVSPVAVQRPAGASIASFGSVACTPFGSCAATRALAALGVSLQRQFADVDLEDGEVVHRGLDYGLDSRHMMRISWPAQ